MWWRAAEGRVESGGRLAAWPDVEWASEIGSLSPTNLGLRGYVHYRNTSHVTRLVTREILVMAARNGFARNDLVTCET